MYQDIEQRVSQMMSLAEKLKTDESLRHQFTNAPMDHLGDLNIEVPLEFTTAVTNSCSDINEIAKTLNREKQSAFESRARSLIGTASGSTPLPPSGLFVQNTSVETPTPPKLPPFEFKVTEWGLVVVLPEPVLKQFYDGAFTAIDLTKAFRDLLDKLSGLATAAALTTPAAVILAKVIGPLLAVGALWCAIQACWIAAEIGAIAIVDSVHQQGVYLIWTWVGIALTAYLPIPTPIIIEHNT